jgi:hypothetical protein
VALLGPSQTILMVMPHIIRHDGDLIGGLGQISNRVT